MFTNVIDVCAITFAILSIIDVFSSHSGMGFLDKCAALVLWIGIIVFIRYCIVLVYNTVKTVYNSGKCKSKVSAKPVSEVSSQNHKNDADIISSMISKEALKLLKAHYRVFTLAGGTDPILPPLVSFDRDGNITLKKHGYDIDPTYLDQYNNSSLEWKEREFALNMFAEELFGEYTEMVKKHFSIEYIADHLITLERCHEHSADFYLTISIFSIENINEQSLLRKELSKTNIYNFE